MYAIVQNGARAINDRGSFVVNIALLHSLAPSSYLCFSLSLFLSKKSSLLLSVSIPHDSYHFTLDENWDTNALTSLWHPFMRRAQSHVIEQQQLNFERVTLFITADRPINGDCFLCVWSAVLFVHTRLPLNCSEICLHFIWPSAARVRVCARTNEREHLYVLT